MRKLGVVALVSVALICGTVFAQEKAKPTAKKAEPVKVKKEVKVERTITKKVKTGEIREIVPIFGIQVLPGIVKTPEEVRYESAEKCAVKVLKVFPGTMADRIGLQPGDMIYKLNGKQITSFGKLMEIIGDMRPEDKGKIEFLRGRATHVQEFDVENTFVDDINILYIWHTKTNKFIGRAYVCGPFSVYKEMANDACKEFSICGPFLWDWKRHGTSEKLTILFFFNFEKGDKTPIVF
ncbi:MAG: PDZ domain-containing protein [Planctomycetes bacterium]|nr:PDZ domain-containing protein [Planctomycetota bacterium]